MPPPEMASACYRGALQAPPVRLDSLIIDGGGLHLAADAVQLFATARTVRLAALRLQLTAPDPLLGAPSQRQWDVQALLLRPDLRHAAALLAACYRGGAASALIAAQHYELMLAAPAGGNEPPQQPLLLAAAAGAEDADGMPGVVPPLMAELSSSQLAALLRHRAVRQQGVSLHRLEAIADGVYPLLFERGRGAYARRQLLKATAWSWVLSGCVSLGISVVELLLFGEGRNSMTMKSGVITVGASTMHLINQVINLVFFPTPVM